jgi:hypothetical protein
MKIPIRYGLFAALGLMVWVLLAHTLVANPESVVHKLLAPIFFNVLHFVMISLGIGALQRERGGTLSFKEALKTGVAIAFVFALAACLFFAVAVLFVGTRWLTLDPRASGNAGLLLAPAFAGLFLGTMIFGLLYSTVIAAFLAKRRSQ